MEYFKKHDGYIWLEAPYAEFYIPKEYFDIPDFAMNYGDHIDTIGLMNVGFFTNGKLQEMRILNIPTKTTIFVNDSEERFVQFPHGASDINCVVVKYNKGAQIMPDSVVQDSSNAEKFLDLINKGKLPTTLPYSKTFEIWARNRELNGVSLGGIPSVIFELILSAAYRYKKDPSKKFGQAAAEDPSITDYDYVINSVREICRNISTFTGVTYEDIDAMITTALNRTKSKKPEAYSPVEDLIKL